MNKALSYFKEISFVLILFVFVYNPPFVFFPVYPGILISLVSFLFLVLYFFLRKKTFYSFKVVSPFLLIVALIFYSYFIVFFHRTSDLVISKGFILFLIAYFFGPNYILILLKKNNDFQLKTVISYFVYIAVIQCIIMIIMMSSPSMKMFIFNLQSDDRQMIHLQSGGFRMLGLAYGVVWDLGFLQSLSAIFIVWLIPQTNSVKKVWFLSFAYLLVFISILFSGRTGFIGVLLSVLLLFFNTFTYSTSLRYVKFIVKILICLFLSINLIYASLSADFRELVTDKLLPWAFEIFINSQEGNGLESGSTNALKDMYFEISTSTFLFGDGYYADPSDKSAYYKGTDGGYMRQILFYGIFGSLMLYFFYFLIFRNILLKTYKNYDKSTFTMMLLITFYYFFSHIKGDMLMGGDMPLRLLFLLYFLILNSNPEDSV